MSIFYHAPTKSFLDTAVHGAIPDDAVEVMGSRKLELLEGERVGLVITVDANGKPVLTEPVYDPAAREVAERAWRDTELSQVTWLRDRHRDELELGRSTTLTAEQYVELLEYMQQLRDWPQSDQFPSIEQRPQPPAWIAEQTQ